MYSNSPENESPGRAAPIRITAGAGNKSLGDLAGVAHRTVGVVFGYALHFVEDVIGRGRKPRHNIERIKNENILSHAPDSAPAVASSSRSDGCQFALGIDDEGTSLMNAQVGNEGGGAFS